MQSPSISPIVLAQGGNPLMRISIPSGATAVEEFAADDLRRHLHNLIGATPMLHREFHSGMPTIYLNDTVAAQAAGINIQALKLGSEAFHLETRQGNLYVLAGGQRGVLYGVYDVLEMLGCRWFAPEVTHIPRRPHLELPAICKTSSPAFEYRDTYCWEGGDALWWVRNRLNGQYTPVPNYLGGQLTYGMFVHTFYTLVPPKEFFSTHPEYFSLLHGNRTWEQGQLCLTNPQVLRLVIDRVLESMRMHPTATLFSVSQNDWHGACECAQCQKVVEEEGSESGPLLRFVNAVAAATSRIFPDKLIDTLAYQYTLDAPRHVVPHANVRVRLCPICCCQGHTFGTCAHQESQRFLHALDAWSAVTSQLYIWHYCTNFANFPLPMPDFDELHGNIQLYQQHGVYGIFMQGNGQDGGGGESMALRGYVLSKLLWNPQQPVWPIIDEFLAVYYGAAAPKVRCYLDLFHQRVCDDLTLHPSLYDPPTHPLFAGDIVPRADAVLQEGEVLVRGEQRRRLRLLHGGLTFARLATVCGEFRREDDSYHGDATVQDLHDFDVMIREREHARQQPLGESLPLQVSAMKQRNRLLAHKVIWLRDGDNSLAIVPDLGGRLLEWHAFGRQWLSPADPTNTYQLYPMSGGYSEFVIPSVYEFLAWYERYRFRRQGDSLVLTLDMNKGFRLTRRYQLRQESLTINSRVENLLSEPVSCSWGSSMQLTLPSSCSVSYPNKQGIQTLLWENLPEGLAQAMVLDHDRLPDGKWQVELPEYRITQQFAANTITRAILGKVAATVNIALDLRSSIFTLAPGEAFTTTQQIDIERC